MKNQNLVSQNTYSYLYFSWGYFYAPVICRGKEYENLRR